jgi:hypothetical protein
MGSVRKEEEKERDDFAHHTEMLRKLPATTAARAALQRARTKALGAARSGGDLPGQEASHKSYDHTGEMKGKGQGAPPRRRLLQRR